MKFPALILCLILSSQILSSQIPTLPPESSAQFVASITSFWPAPPPVRTLTFSLPTKLTIQTSADLQTWVDYAPAIATFTVTNNGTQQFFRISREIRFKLNQLVAIPNYLPGNEWLTNYNRCVGFSVALLDEQGNVTRVLRDPATVTLRPEEVSADYWLHWQDKDGHEI